MSEPAYLAYMKITADMLKSIHIQPVGEYFNRVGDRDHLLALMQGENALLIHGDLETAVCNLQTVYDSIPASEKIVRQHAQLALSEAKSCQRHARK